MLSPHRLRPAATLALVASLLLTGCGEDEPAASDPASVAELDEAARSAAAEAARSGPAQPGDDGADDAGDSVANDATSTDSTVRFEPRLLDPGVLQGADVVVPLGTDQVVVAPSDPSVSAYGEAALSFTGDRVSVVVAVEVAEDDVPIGAGVYRGEPGLDGPSVLDLGDFAPGSPLGQAVWFVEQESRFLAESYRSGDLGSFYVEVVTVSGPTGLARGQLVED